MYICNYFLCSVGRVHSRIVSSEMNLIPLPSPPEYAEHPSVILFIYEADVCKFLVSGLVVVYTGNSPRFSLVMERIYFKFWASSLLFSWTGNSVDVASYYL